MSCTGHFKTSWKVFIAVAMVQFTPILNYSNALSELKLKKSYVVYILEKYIPLLQFTKCIMLRSSLKYIWKGFEIVLRHYVIFKTEFYAHEFAWELSSNRWCFYQWLISTLCFRFVTCGTDLVKYSYWKRCFIKQVKVSAWHILWFVFIHN